MTNFQHMPLFQPLDILIDPTRTSAVQNNSELLQNRRFIFWGVDLGLAKQQNIVTGYVSSGLQVFLYYAQRCFDLHRFLYDTTLCVWRDTTAV